MILKRNIIGKISINIKLKYEKIYNIKKKYYWENNS